MRHEAVTDLMVENGRLVDLLREINKIVWTPTRTGQHAYTHFCSDFTRIRDLTAPFLRSDSETEVQS